MNPRRNPLPAGVAVIVAAACLLSARAGGAACTYYSVDTLTNVGINVNPAIIQLSQSQPVWSAFALRPAAGEDWDVSLYQNSAPEPACVATPLASSTFGGSVVDFVIGDYAFNPAGTYYALCNRYSGSGLARGRWSNSAQIMTVNGVQLNRSWTISNVIETWNVALTAGTTYTIDFSPLGLDAKVLLFRNPGASTYWAGRSAAELATATSTTYTAPTTGTYAVVVVNDNGGAGSFTLRIGTCTTPVALASGVPVQTPLGYDYYQFSQGVSYWTAVGVRSTVADYDVGAYSGTGGSWPSCFTGFLAVSPGVGVADFVIGDFNKNPIGTYYSFLNDYSTRGGADVEWDSGADQLTVDGPPYAGASGGSDVLQVWDVFLSAGRTYNFAYSTSDSTVRLLLFRNTGGGVYWSGRSGAQFDVTGCRTYTAPTSGYYGVVVVNDTGVSATYTLGVSESPCTCPVPLAPLVPTLTASPDAYFRFDQYPYTWGIVATRGVTNADDWDLTVAGNVTGNTAPVCFSNTLISSAYGAGLVDIGVIDFNHTPLGTYYARTHHYSGGAPAGVMEWDWSHGELLHNGPKQFAAMPSIDLAHVWDAWMEAGQTYVLDYAPTDVTIKLMVFENAARGSYLVSRAASVLTTSGVTTYTPTITGYHGLVVVNDQAVSGSYALRFGHCTGPIALVANTTVVAPEGVNRYSIAQTGNRWAAVGLRSGTKDWDIRVSATVSGPFPNCVGGSLATSSSGALDFVDFVTGDFFHNIPSHYYIDAYQFSDGALDGAPVEWAPGAGEILVNDNNFVQQATGGSNVLLQSWNVFMQSGQSYQFNFTHTGAANLHLLLFQNAGGSTYWTGRSGAVADRAPVGTFTYVPPTTGEYGIVVVNDDGAADNYSIDIKTCFPPSALVSGVVTLDAPVNFHSFNQGSGFWTAIGVRSTSDWDITVNANVGGGPPGICQSGMLAVSNAASLVDFVVGDFNAGANPLGTYYSRPYRYAGTGIGSVEWDSGSDVISEGPPLHRNTDANDVLEMWDVFLTAGQAYGIYFARSGTADVRVMLFHNPGGVYWAPRSASVYQNTTHGNFTAPSTGWYGLVVVNDNGGTGGYDVGLTRSALAVDPGELTGELPLVTSLRAVQPNPARAHLNVEYTLSERAPVHVQMIDLAGRVVADIEHQTRDAGVWRTAWNGRTALGTRAAPGVYLVRLEVGGRTIGQRKVTVLE